MLSPIPAWIGPGVIPPVDFNNPISRYRSPYTVSLTDVIRQFGTSLTRCTILRGFLDYRAAWHTSGQLVGYQWLTGSFVEDVENIRGRPPGDIDVVTVLRMPDVTTQSDMEANFPEAFGADPDLRKNKYHVDAYLIDLLETPENLIEDTLYWYSLFAHTRGAFLWKGFLRIDLAPIEDTSANNLLSTLEKGFTP